jgi:hypothetical protein
VSDDFLSPLREEPSPEFTGRLEARLREIDAQQRERGSASARYRRLAPALASAALLAGLAGALTLEPVRAAARSFLDLFRVRRFAAVPVDPQRLARLKQGGLDLKSLIGDQVQVVTPPGPAEVVSSPEAAGVLAGMTVALPSALPARAELAETRLARPGHFRVVIDNGKLEALRDLAGASEIEIPAFWHGTTIDVETPPVVAARFARSVEASEGRPAREESFVLLQSKVPQVELPEGFDLATLGRLGLRVAGMSATEAESFAQAIDWRTTLLVPVPVQGGTFREVEVSGHKGLLVTFEPPATPRPDGADRPRRTEALLLWSTADKVFALQGPARRGTAELVEMAQSVG